MEGIDSAGARAALDLVKVKAAYIHWEGVYRDGINGMERRLGEIQEERARIIAGAKGSLPEETRDRASREGGYRARRQVYWHKLDALRCFGREAGLIE